jgi:uncharacterized membrane protein (GlpM family)
MTTLVLKLALTPVLITGASVAGRRWGGAVSGWLVGLPLTSGPVAVFLAVEHGPRFAGRAAVGSLSGAAAEAAFCIGYGRLAARGTTRALAAGTAGFALLGGAAEALPLRDALPSPLLPLFAAALLALGAAALTLPRDGLVPATAAPPARWDLPARAVVATALVLLFTGVATALGARLTGLLAVYPLYAAVLTVFAQRRSGPRAGVAVLRGVAFGLFSFATFFFVLASLLGRIDTAGAFACSVVAALLVQTATLARLTPWGGFTTASTSSSARGSSASISSSSPPLPSPPTDM